MTNIYSGFFLEQGHVTWEFAPGACTLPAGLQEGSEVEVVVIGKYEDDDVACDIVKVVLPNGKVLTNQGSGTLLHMTTKVGEGISPVLSGVRATENGYTSLPEDQYTSLTARADYFKA
jgi:hypothetical protein